MTASEAWEHEEVQGRARGVLVTVADQLPAMTVGLVDEMIDHNECGVAVEILSEMLVDSGARISEETLAGLSSLVEKMSLDPINVDPLRPLVDASDQT